MMVRTQYVNHQFTVEVDGRTVVQRSETPEEYSFAYFDSETLTVGRKPHSFLSRRTYFLEDSRRSQIASISVSAWILGWTGRSYLELNGVRHRITRKKVRLLSMRDQIWRIEGLGIDCQMETSLLGYEIYSSNAKCDDVSVGLTLLLHYFRLKIWMESD